MGYIGKYSTSGDVQTAVNNLDLKKPYVALVGNEIDWNSYTPDYSTLPLTLKITSDGIIKMLGRANTTYSINGSEFKYLPNASYTNVTVVAGDIIIFKNVDTVYGATFKNSTAGFVVFGNIQYYKTGTTNSYQGMFRGCTGLTDASNLILPVTGTATSYSYYDMFNGCTSLTTAPVLPATTLANNSCNNMFLNCSSLNYVKCLATTIQSGSIDYWLLNVQTSGTFVKKAGVTWPSGTSGIPNNWTVIEE